MIEVCLVAFAWQVHPDYPLILAGNRDELHDRPAAPARWWIDANHVYGGRDLVAGGSWLGISRSGRLAVVTNFPGRPAPANSVTSRGHLVRDYLLGVQSPATYAASVRAAVAQYAGFRLVVATPSDARVVSSHGETGRSRRLEPGILTITNSRRGEPWPKAAYIREAMAKHLATGSVDEERLFEFLGRRRPVEAHDDEAGDPRVRARSTPFVLNDRYGTRASTVVTVDWRGQCRFRERRYDRTGACSGESRVEFVIEGDDRRPR